MGDGTALNGILFVLRTGIPWEELPQELGFGSGMTCWRRLRDWQAAGVWNRLHLLLLHELRGAGKLDFSRASVASPGGQYTGPNTDHRPQPHGQGQARQQAPHHHGPPRHPADLLSHGCQPA